MSVYKLYLNFDGSDQLPEHTFIHKSAFDSTDTVLEVTSRFCTVYNEKFKQRLSAELLHLVTDNDTPLEAQRQITQAACSGSDITVVLRDADRKPPASAFDSLSVSVGSLAHTPDSPATAVQGKPDEVHASSTCTPQSNGDINAELDTATVQQLKLGCPSNPQKCSPVIKQFLERAREAESKKYFRAACKIYEQVGHCWQLWSDWCFVNIKYQHRFADAGAQYKPCT